MIELKNIEKKYAPKKGKAVNALKGINLTFGENGMTFVLGKSGSGKSTLLHVIGGMDKPTGGEIRIDGRLQR